ncbi:Hypothetical protein NTJ_00674 [Nesidiocoris tenuis]|uniref:Uncharacterized protein n=1 Tax=Nesidiocoris tenuis TaxID=355587 RepID=A0ABN7A6K4_9HEMI|nr:Hypothetical protein NTJ_00674 [Nesidiocoris tenuis]
MSPNKGTFHRRAEDRLPIGTAAICPTALHRCAAQTRYNRVPPGDEIPATSVPRSEKTSDRPPFGFNLKRKRKGPLFPGDPRAAIVREGGADGKLGHNRLPSSR